MKDLQVALLKSQIAHQDIPQDTAFFSTLYKFARIHKIKYILTDDYECLRGTFGSIYSVHLFQVIYNLFATVI